MTWQWTIIVCVLVMVVSESASRYLNELVARRALERRLFEMDQLLTDLNLRVLTLAQDQEVVKRLSEDTKKLLSQQNLSLGLRGR